VLVRKFTKKELYAREVGKDGGGDETMERGSYAAHNNTNKRRQM
jgi:hypothetical protein